ncbi:MAG: Gfo/Idh/MocA family oxidoreductase [Spirochaetaceae bacterium]|jgi:predicted dehydrogenase|nr:Gfo/Idh/MocA family oxidoreductase [Spirochaetaceae bacterium]
MEKLKAGIIGAGNISGIYIKNLRELFSDRVDLCAIANMSPEKAREAAARHGLDFAESPDALLARDDIAIVLNLTPPAAHYPVAKAALEAGKHIYNEKPLCANLADGEALLDLAQKNNVRISCAPDTFLGAGIQTARKLIDDGWIGRPVAGVAFLMNHGPEHWHPAPEFFYAPGGGPLFDMGPYYLTALAALLGPVASVTGNATTAFDTRDITSKEQYGKKIPVTTPTHISAQLDFSCGATLSLTMSFDVWSHSLPHIEIYGSEGSLQIGDPNFFISPVRLKRRDAAAWQEIPLIGPASPRLASLLDNENWRGIGVADMADAIQTNRRHRASGALALHILEVMTRILESSETGKRLAISHRCERPEKLNL